MRPAGRNACVWLGSWGRSRSFLVGLQQLGDAIGELGAVAGPVLDTVLFQQNACRVCTRVVSTNNFNRTPIARTIFLDHDYSVVRLLTRSKARQTYHQHRVSVPFSILFRIVSGLFSGQPAIAGGGDGDLARTTPNPSSMAKSVVFRKSARLYSLVTLQAIGADDGTIAKSKRACPTGRLFHVQDDYIASRYLGKS